MAKKHQLLQRDIVKGVPLVWFLAEYSGSALKSFSASSTVESRSNFLKATNLRTVAMLTIANRACANSSLFFIEVLDPETLKMFI